jgi:hypothetical protein
VSKVLLQNARQKLLRFRQRPIDMVHESERRHRRMATP